MKMSEIDHANSLDPDQAQQNVWQDPKEFKKCLGQKKRYSAKYIPLKQKRRYIRNTMIRETYDQASYCPASQE